MIVPQHTLDVFSYQHRRMVQLYLNPRELSSLSLISALAPVLFLYQMSTKLDVGFSSFRSTKCRQKLNQNTSGIRVSFVVHWGLNMSGGYQQHATLLFPLASLLILDKKQSKSDKLWS